MTRVSFLESGSLVKLHRMVKAWRSEVEPLGFIEPKDLLTTCQFIFEEAGEMISEVTRMDGDYLRRNDGEEKLVEEICDVLFMCLTGIPATYKFGNTSFDGNLKIYDDEFGAICYHAGMCILAAHELSRGDVYGHMEIMARFAYRILYPDTEERMGERLAERKLMLERKAATV